MLLTRLMRLKDNDVKDKITVNSKIQKDGIDIILRYLPRDVVTTSLVSAFVVANSKYDSWSLLDLSL